MDYRGKRFRQDPVYACDGSIPSERKEEADENEREEGELTPS